MGKSPLLPELPEDRQLAEDRRARFLEILDGGVSSDLLAARVGLTEDGLEAGLRLGNLAMHAISGATTKREND